MKFWCPKCAGAQEQRGSVLVPIRETKPHYQYWFQWFPACEERHAMVGLCEGCGQAPSAEGMDYCETCWPEDADEPIADTLQPGQFKRDRSAA